MNDWPMADPNDVIYTSKLDVSMRIYVLSINTAYSYVRKTINFYVNNSYVFITICGPYLLYMVRTLTVVHRTMVDGRMCGREPKVKNAFITSTQESRHYQLIMSNYCELNCIWTKESHLHPNIFVLHWNYQKKKWRGRGVSADAYALRIREEGGQAAAYVRIFF